MANEPLMDTSAIKAIERTVSDLVRSDSNGFERHIKKLSAILHSSSFEDITQELSSEVDLNSWIQAGRATAGSMVGSARLDWPNETKKELGYVIKLIDWFASQRDAGFQFSFEFFYESNSINGNLRHMTNQMIVPFARDYIEYYSSHSKKEEVTQIDQRPNTTKRKVFVVHGHDEHAREAVARFLEKLDFEVIILHEQANRGRTIIEKIEAHRDVGFAVILLTPDDEGGPTGGPYAPRARQNVLIELGFFIGYLGRERVCALRRGEVEVPSDFAGVVYEVFDSAGAWKPAIGRELQAAGFDIDWNSLYRTP